MKYFLTIDTKDKIADFLCEQYVFTFLLENLQINLNGFAIEYLQTIIEGLEVNFLFNLKNTHTLEPICILLIEKRSVALSKIVLPCIKDSKININQIRNTSDKALLAIECSAKDQVIY